jgi:hypothetical protein
MPPRFWTMTDSLARYYPGTRDAYGVPLGDVQPGDVIERDEAPDQFWAPYGGGDGETRSKDRGQDGPGSDTTDDEAGATGSEES